MNVDVGIWSKLTKIVVGLIVAAGLVAITLVYLPQIQKNERYRKEIMRLDEQIQKADALAKQTREQIESMRNPEVVARLAHHLGQHWACTCGGHALQVTPLDAFDARNPPPGYFGHFHVECEECGARWLWKPMPYPNRSAVGPAWPRPSA